MSVEATKVSYPPIVWAFLLGNLIIGTGVMLAPGLLNVLAADLKISVPTAGSIIGLSAVVICVGAPLFAMLTSRWDRRRLLAGSLVFGGVLHLLCALAPNFETLLPLRVVAVIAAAIFTPQAASTLGQVLPAERRAGAITFIFLGWSLASVAALPLAAWIGAHVGWRFTFAGYGALSILGAWAVARATPKDVQGIALSLSAWGQIFRHPVMPGLLLVTALSATGQFTTWGYFAPYTHAMIKPSPELFSVLLSVFGFAGLMGNVVASRNAARSGRAFGGAAWNVHLACASMALGFAILLSGAQLMGVFLAGSLIWGVGVFASNSSQQARLAMADPNLAGASIALNTSMIYLGQAAGAFTGGAVISSAGFAALPWAGVVLMSAAVAVSVWVQRKVS
jgi:predicted MFS family arabinose efflux permease